jgi:hypothetical protein
MRYGVFNALKEGKKMKEVATLKVDKFYNVSVGFVADTLPAINIWADCPENGVVLNLEDIEPLEKALAEAKAILKSAIAKQ